MFDDAWRESLDVIRQDKDAELWMPVMASTTTTWRRAFDLRPPVRREDACGRIAIDAVEHRDTVDRLVA